MAASSLPQVDTNMQALASSSRVAFSALKQAKSLSLYSTASTYPTPWFVDESSTRRREPPPHMVSRSLLETKPVPQDAPPILSALHAELSKSPLLENNGVEVCQPLPTLPGPALPSAIPKGRRQRGRTEFGMGVPDAGGSLWKWIVLAQVKEGSEGRGAIESVMRIVRRTLLTSQASVTLPPNKKRRVQDGWGMLDAGDFAVHVLSRSARETYFPVEQHSRTWQY